MASTFSIESLLRKLDELLDGEIRLSDAIPPCTSVATSELLGKELGEYAGGCSGGAEKLKQALIDLSYVPGAQKNRVIEKLVSSTKEMLSTLDSGKMRDVLMTSCIQTINDYKISNYTIALSMARQLGNTKEIEAILQGILDHEKTTAEALKSVAVAVNTQSE